MNLNPYIHFSGNAEEALNFYADVLGGTILMKSRYSESPMPCEDADKDNLMHGRLEFDGNILMVSDMPSTFPINKGNNFAMSVSMDDPDKMEVIFNKMAEGGNITMPLADQFWGAKFGMLVDKFGTAWMFNCELKK